MRRLLAAAGGIGVVAASFALAGCGQLAGAGPPTCFIVAPGEDGATVYVGDEVAFEVHASDGGTTPNLIGFAWTSSLGDALPSGSLNDDGDHAFSTDDLAPGAHTITATITDPDGEQCTDTVLVTVLSGDAPVIVIDTPRSDGFYYVDRPLNLRSRVSDTEDHPQDLRVFWAVEDGVGLAEGLEPDAEGVTTIERGFEIGRHVLQARVVDTHGNIGTAGVAVEVGGPNQPPDCAILSPLDGAVVPHGPDLELLAEATDPNVPGPVLAVSFSSDVDGPLGDATPDDDGDVALTAPTLSVGAHELTLVVVDDLGLDCTDRVDIVVDEPPVAEITAPTATTPASSNLALVLGGLATDREDANEDLTVEWFSDREGLVADKAAEPSGVLDDEVLPDTLVGGAHLITLEVTDSIGSTATDSVTILVNGAPNAPVAALGPPGPTTLDTLTASVATPANDPENDPLTYAYSWTIDGVPAPAYDGLQSIPDTATSKAETWQVLIRAFDGQTYGPPGTADVIIDNTPPVGGSATASPTLGTTATTFSLTTTGWQDVDGDPEGYLYQWVVSGAAVAGATSATFVPGTSAVAGDPLHCELTPWDGADIGPMFLSAPAFINVPAAPTAVTVTPTPGYEDTPLQAAYTGGVDPEGASTTVAYQWYRDNATIPPTAIAGATTAALTGADFDHFDDVWVGVTIDDGTEVGPEVLSNVVPILNTVPAATAPAVVPAILYTETQATCATGVITDPDPDAVTWEYEWLVQPVGVIGGTVVATTAGLDGGAIQTGTATFFDRGDSVWCRARPHDGWDYGAWQESTHLTVANSPPLAPVVDITPDVPGVLNDLTCLATTPAIDPDGDPVSTARFWTRNGQSVLQTGQTIDESLTFVNDLWTCSMNGHDGFDPGPSGTDSVTVQPALTLGPGAAGSTYSQDTETRGMWFEAPANMTITTLWIPADSNAGDFQNVEVLVFPSTWGAGSSTTTPISLFYAALQPAADVMVVNIPVLAGEKIGVLGGRGNTPMHSMYSQDSTVPGVTPVVVPYGSATVQVWRLEYDANLALNPLGAPGPVAVEDAAGPIGRVEIEYIP